MTEHPLQPLHVLRRKLEGFLSIHILSNTLRAQPRWIKIHASQHPASKNRFRSEEWWWRCCKTVGRGKFCVMRLWNACEDCSYHHTLAGDDPSLWARVWCSHQPGGVKEGGGVAPDQSASVWTQRFYRRRQQWKKANQKWHKCGFNNKEPKIYRSMQKGLETSLTAAIWISTWIKKNKLTLRRTFPLPLSRLGLSGCPQHPPPRYSSAWYFPHSATSRSPIFAQSLLEI